MEGKEVRFGLPASALFAVIPTTDASCGAVNAMHSSFTALGGMIPLINIQLGEIIVGGVGSGLYGMLLYVILAIFVAGLMVGRTPEYLGKKIEGRDMRLVMLALLCVPFAINGFTALASAIPAWRAAMDSAPTGAGPLNAGPHGFTEMLYAYSSAAGNNGSAFAGLTANSPFWNLTLGLAMLVGPVRHDRADAGGRRLACGETKNSGVLWDIPDARAALHRPRRRRHPDHGRTDLFPGAHAWPHRRAVRAAARTLVLRNSDGSQTCSFRLAPAILGPAIGDAFKKFDPRWLARNPVIFVTAIAALMATIFFVRDLSQGGNALFSGQIAVWLWLTVLFANLAEAVAEGRGKAQAESLRRTRTETIAKRIAAPDATAVANVPAPDLKIGDLVLCEPGDVIPGDGEVIQGVATVDESAITGESAPVIRELGGDRSAVTGGTRVLSDRIVVRITAERGSSFLDRMIALVEGADRRKTPNEIALAILLAALSIIFLIAVGAIPGFAFYSHGAITGIALVALLIALIPTTIAGLVSAIGVAGMNCLVRFNVLAMSGRAVEAAGDVDVLLLDKTGTITLGNRQATEFHPLTGVTEQELAEAAQLASLADETPEGRSIVVLAKERHGLRPRDPAEAKARFIPFTAQTRMSGADWAGSKIRKGAVDAIVDYLKDLNGPTWSPPAMMQEIADRIARAGGTPIAVAQDGHPLGVVYLKDIVKGGVKERFAEMRAMGIRTVMITGDNPLTAAAIAAEAGVDDFLARSDAREVS